MWPGKKHKYETHFLTSLFVSFFVYLVVLAIPYAGHSSETNGEVRRGWLGVKAQDLNPDLAAIFELK
ncbi:MAG: hypothetical protein MIO92_06875, partial [Methanosarcinaceae archaeon]|nr:hypothetical protein [Methanosarcinaceae archaeon]